ncbi:MAG: hypothetical protein SPI06_08235 [Terrisporobacter sp.]|uniref:hypothetical protein n=1 Tax=Terrisporobacter sp. TaxID=1965305 RepID=UPI002A90B5C9|nr:hypothetical protein [Terrisporobacter sp.]MDY6153386.1 hypothetical protein [Terrisporobacter sp.]
MDKIILNNKMLDTVLFWFSGARDKELREIPLDYYENKIHIMGSRVKPYVKGKGIRGK